MIAQKRLLLDFMDFMKSPEYKSQLEAEIAKEKVYFLFQVILNIQTLMIKC